MDLGIVLKGQSILIYQEGDRCCVVILDIMFQSIRGYKLKTFNSCRNNSVDEMSDM